MRYLLIALMLTVASASAQNVNEKPASGEKPPAPAQGTPTQGTAVPDPAAKGSAAQGATAPGTAADDQKFIASAIKAAGSKEAAARIEITRGWKQLKQGDLEVAIQSFTHAYVLDPKNVEVYWGLGNAMTQQGKFAAASTYYERAIKIEPQNPKLMADMGLSQTYSAFKSTPKPEEQAKLAKDAMRWFDNAEKIDPNRPVIYAHRAIALYMLGNYAEAWKNVEKAEALERTSVDPAFLADLTAKQARPESKPPAAKSEDAAIKTETVATPPVAQPEKAQPASAKEQAPLPTTKLTPQIRDPNAPQQAPAPTAAPLAPVKQAQEEKKNDAEQARVTGKTATEDGDEQKAAASEKTPVPAQQEKQLEVVQEKPLPQIGPDKRKCLDLPTQEEIIRCVYPGKK